MLSPLFIHLFFLFAPVHFFSLSFAVSRTSGWSSCSLVSATESSQLIMENACEGQGQEAVDSGGIVTGKSHFLIFLLTLLRVQSMASSLLSLSPDLPVFPCAELLELVQHFWLKEQPMMQAAIQGKTFVLLDSAP